jgi:hypothetical protein
MVKVMTVVTPNKVTKADKADQYLKLDIKDDNLGARWHGIVARHLMKKITTRCIAVSKIQAEGRDGFGKVG